MPLNPRINYGAIKRLAFDVYSGPTVCRLPQNFHSLFNFPPLCPPCFTAPGYWLLQSVPWEWGVITPVGGRERDVSPLSLSSAPADSRRWWIAFIGERQTQLSSPLACQIRLPVPPVLLTGVPVTLLVPGVDRKPPRVNAAQGHSAIVGKMSRHCPSVIAEWTLWLLCLHVLGTKAGGKCWSKTPSESGLWR